jgi:hypothetical protein
MAFLMVLSAQYSATGQDDRNLSADPFAPNAQRSTGPDLGPDPFAPNATPQQKGTPQQAKSQARSPAPSTVEELQQELHELLRPGYRDGDADRRINALIKEISRRMDLKERISKEIAEENPFDNQSRDSIAATQAKLADRERQLQDMSQHVKQLVRQLEEQPIEGAVAQIFPLRHAKAAEAAGTLESLFGSQVRVAVDERSNNLVVSGKEKSLEAVRSLLQGLDEPAVASNDGSAITASPARTVLLRVFWLADGLPGEEGQDPGDFLPPAVIDATTRLGLNSPRLVSQTVNSLAIGDQPEVQFATQVPAVLLGQHATLQCAGSMRPISDDRTGLNMDIHVSGPAINCELKGSLATPLGHYMVLGTANSVIAEPMAMGGGMEMGGGFEGGRGGEAGFGMADPAAAVPGAEGGMGRGMEGMAPQAPKYNTSRFAFVVQVIEGESFPAEK